MMIRKSKSIKLTRSGSIVMVLRDGQDQDQHYMMDLETKQVLAFYTEGGAVRTARRIRRTK